MFIKIGIERKCFNIMILSSNKRFFSTRFLKEEDRMASYNKVTLIGHLTKDPEVKQVGNDLFCRLTLATNHQYKNKKTGVITQEVCYTEIAVWGLKADYCHQYLEKGRPVLVEGRLKLDSWKDQSGQSRSKHSVVANRVVFLGSGHGTAQRAQVSPDNANDPDDLPFQ